MDDSDDTTTQKMDNGNKQKEDELITYIKGFDIQDLKGNSIINDGAVFNRYQAIKLVYDFEIPQNTKAKDFTMTIDDCILIKQKMVADLIIDSEKIGEAIFNTNHTVEIKFQENTFTSTLKGKFYIQTYFDQEVIGDTNNNQVLKFNVGGTSQKEISINFQEVSQDDTLKCNIVKENSYDSATQTITWRIFIHQNGVDMNHSKIIDKLEPYQEFIKDSVEIFDYHDRDRIGEKLPYKYTDSTRVLSINELSFVNDWITVSFKTKVDPKFFTDSNDNQLITNKASFRLADDENKVKYSNESQVNPRPNLINKYGQWNKFERKINWTLNINEQVFSKGVENRLDLKNCVVTDVLPDCLELDLDSGIYVDGEQLESGDYEYIPSTALTAKRDDKEFFPDKSVFSYQYVSDDPEKCGKLKIDLGDIEGTHKIKFTTNIKNELYQRNFWSYVVNECTLTTDGDDNEYFKGTYTYKSNPVYITMSPISKMAIENGSHWVEKDGQLLEEPLVYNPRNRTLLWQIGINTDGIPIDKATITDKLQDGLKYTGNVSVIRYLPYDKNYNPNCDQWQYRFLVDSDKKLRYFWCNANYYGEGKPGGPWLDPYNEFNCAYNEDTNTVIFKINNAFNCQYVIYFETKITDPSIYASNEDIKIRNTASIKFGDSDKEILSNEWITNGRLTKSEMIKLNAINYDCISRKITWSGIVNRNKLFIKEGNIFDEIEPDQKYVDGSFKIEKYDINTEESKGILFKDSTEGENVTNESGFSHVPATEDSKESLNYYLGDSPSDETYLVTFETQVTDESIYKSNVEKPVRNSLSLKGAKDADVEEKYENLPLVSDTAEINVKSSVIQKDGVFHPEEETIDWSIGININKLYLKEAIIEDKFQKGLDLDVNSIEIYPLSINADGSYNISGEPISKNKYQIEDYNPEENNKDDNYVSDQRILTVKFLDPIQEAYMLKFTTKADIQYAPFYNTARFKGMDESGNESSDSSNNVKIPGIVGDVGADVQKEEGSVSAFVIDADNNQSEGLKGAKFEIYYGGNGESYNPDNENSKDAGKVDDETGKIKFRQLNYGWYKIIETKAPDGYKLPDNPADRVKYIKINSQANKEVVFENIKIPEDTTGQIKILKTDENGNPLEGAKFMLKTFDGAEQDIQVSQQDGIVMFKNVPFGTYSIEEVQAPQGYSLDSDNEELKNIVIDSNRKNVELTVKNNMIVEPSIKGSIKITKVAEEDRNKKLEGAKFNLYTTGDYDNVLSTKVSDLNGLIVFDGLPDGVYDIKEIEAPDGYEISKAFYKGIRIDSDNGKNVDIEISNKLKENNGEHDNPPENEPTDKPTGNHGSGSSGSGGSSAKPSGSSDGDSEKNIENEEVYDEFLYTIGKYNSKIKSWVNESKPKSNTYSNHSNPLKLSEELDVDNNGLVFLPQAGKMIDTKVLITVGLMFINIGIYFMIKKKYM